MLLPGDLSPADRAAVEAQMCGTYLVRSNLLLLDLNHRLVQDVSRMRSDAGTVTVDASQVVTRSVSLELSDPTRQVALDTDAAGEHAATPKYMLQAYKGLFVDALDRWVDIPAFCGPITKPARDGDVLKVEAQDKAALGSRLARRSLTIKKGTAYVAAIRLILRELVGETRFRLPTSSKRLTKDYTVTIEKTPIASAKSLARQAGWVLFYDALGYCTVRAVGSAPVFEFRTGPGGSITSKVSAGYWDVEVFNKVEVTGAKPSQVGRAVLQPSHPRSPESLAIGGVPQQIAHRESRPDLSKQADLDAAAVARLASLSRVQTALSFESVPIWHLQEHDPHAVVDLLDGVRYTAGVRQMTFPLGGDGTQSNGFLRRQSKQSSRVKVVRRR